MIISETFKKTVILTVRVRGLYFNVPAGITITDIRYERSSQTIICTTSGGPVTTITWEKNGVPLTPDGSVYQSSQAVIDAASSTYENRLSYVALKSESFSGVYTCQVENLRRISSSQLAVTGMWKNELASY